MSIKAATDEREWEKRNYASRSICIDTCPWTEAEAYLAWNLSRQLTNERNNTKQREKKRRPENSMNSRGRNTRKGCKFRFPWSSRQTKRQREWENTALNLGESWWIFALYAASCLRRDFPISFLNFSSIFHAFFESLLSLLCIYTVHKSNARLRMRLKQMARTQHITLAELWYGCEERTLLYFWQSLSKFYESRLMPRTQQTNVA